MGSRLDLNTVRVFVAVVDAGSFSGAARALTMPGSNVSRHVSQLESRLGVRLLERSTRHLRLTEPGRLLYDRAKPMLDALELTESELTSQRNELRGRLRLCLPAEIGPRVFGPALATFAQQHPGVEIECDTRFAGLDALRDDLDLAIIVNRGPLDDSTVVVRPLARLPSLVVAAPALLARTGMPTHARQLRQLPCITTLSTLKGQPWQFVDAHGDIQRIPVQSRYRVNSGELAGSAALQGVGFAILAEAGCRDALADGRLQAVPLDMHAAPLELLAVYGHRHFVAARVRGLLDHLHAHLRDAGMGALP